MKILHGLTGSVATILLNKFREEYYKEDNTLKYVVTDNSLKFIDGEEFWIELFDDRDEWRTFEHNKTVLHIELTKWADKFIIAPCSANTLAKIANGICDNLLTCCARAWDFNKPFVIAPSMNTHMWNHPITQKHIDTVKSWGIVVKEPVSKTLFCGDVGIGAMADITNILS